MAMSQKGQSRRSWDARDTSSLTPISRRTEAARQGRRFGARAEVQPSIFPRLPRGHIVQQVSRACLLWASGLMTLT
jgi:hypothetical protein